VPRPQQAHFFFLAAHVNEPMPNHIRQQQHTCNYCACVFPTAMGVCQHITYLISYHGQWEARHGEHNVLLELELMTQMTHKISMSTLTYLILMAIITLTCQAVLPMSQSLTFKRMSARTYQPHKLLRKDMALIFHASPRNFQRSLQQILSVVRKLRLNK